MNRLAKHFCSVLILLSFTACSLESKKENGVRVKLVANPKPLNLFNKIASPLLNALDPIDGIEDLHCFAINARGGSIETQRDCQGHLEEGEFDGPYEGLNSTFEVIVPQEPGLIFEAFGSADASCGGDDSSDLNAGGGSTIFKIGGVVADMDKQKEVFIPVAFDTTQAFTCSNDPYLIFKDQFDYPDTSLHTTANWTEACGGASMPLASGAIDSGSISGANCDASRFHIDFSKPYIRISARFRADGTLTSGVDPEFTFGVTNGATAVSAGFGCRFGYPTPATPTTVDINTGGFPNAFTPSGASHTFLTISADSKFVCEIQRESALTYSIRTQIYDFATGALTQSFTDTGITQLSAETSDRVYIRIDGGGGDIFGATSLMDDFTVEQADTKQF